MKEDGEICEVLLIHEEKVNRVKEHLNKYNTDQISNLFKVLADETRLKIVYSLILEKKLCVCDIAQIVGCSPAAASHHLRLIRNLGFAKRKKEGKLVYYYLDDPRVEQFITLAFEHGKR